MSAFENVLFFIIFLILLIFTALYIFLWKCILIPYERPLAKQVGY